MVIVFTRRATRTCFAASTPKLPRRAEGQFYLFHLGHPQISARYNAIGNFSRITEVATRIANKCPAGGTPNRSSSSSGSRTGWCARWWRWAASLAPGAAPLCRELQAADSRLFMHRIVSRRPPAGATRWPASRSTNPAGQSAQVARRGAGETARLREKENSSTIRPPVRWPPWSPTRTPISRSWVALPVPGKVTTGEIADLVSPETRTWPTRDPYSTG